MEVAIQLRFHRGRRSIESFSAQDLRFRWEQKVRRPNRAPAVQFKFVHSQSAGKQT